MGAVVEEKTLVEIAGAEVDPQNGQHSVLRLDLTAQHAPKIREADKPLEEMCLALQMPHRPGHRAEDRVGEVSKEARPLPQQLLNKAVEMDLPIWQAGEKPLAQQLRRPGGAFDHLSVYPARVVPIRRNGEACKQRWNKVLIAADGGGDFSVGVAVKYAAEEALKAAVVAID